MNKIDITWKIFMGYMLMLFLMLLTSSAFAQTTPCDEDICVVQFNAGWNDANSVDYLDELTDCEIKQVSIKTLIAIGAAMATIISMWFMLQADIDEARELPEPPPQDVTRMEFDMKDQMIRQTIITTQEDVKEIKESIEKIEDKLYE